ncbi:MAG: hypothetical protein WCY88_11575 [Spongiibacteraceae bacterium]
MNMTELTKDHYRMGNLKWPAFAEDRARVDWVIIKNVLVCLPFGHEWG